MAVEIDPDFGQAYISLGRTLAAKGDFDAAISSYRLSQGPKRMPYSHGFLTSEMIREAERMTALSARLPAFLRGEDQPRRKSEEILLARLCQIKQLFATSAERWEKVFDSQPGLA